MEQKDYDFIPYIEYVVFRQCTPQWRMPEQFLPSCDLTYIIQGEARYTINGIAHHLSGGDLLCLPPESVREGVTYPDRLMRCFSINFQLKTFKGGLARLPFPVVSHIGCKEDIIRLFHELSSVWVEKQTSALLEARGLFLLILQRFFDLIVYKSDSTAEDPRIKKAIRYIAAHFAEKISVKEMAETVRLNPAYFGALFKRETGVKLTEYLIRTRIHNARNMLASGEYTVCDVAEACGFVDAAHFYKHFKTLMGFPPSRCIPKIKG
jgi:AraC-like DNA-binding protein